MLAQIDIENRTRSSHDLGARYNNAPADLDSVNALSFSNMVLTDINRNNDRTNSLFVLDYNIPKGNISYSGLNSKIKKIKQITQMFLLSLSKIAYIILEKGLMI